MSARRHKPRLQIAEFPADRERLGSELKATFPAIRFLVPLEFCDPEEPALTFVESLADPLVLKRGAEAWLWPSDNWKPLWVPDASERNGIACLNRPAFQIRFGTAASIQSTICWRPLRDDPGWEVEVPIERIGDHLIHATWFGDEPDVGRFVSKVLRLARKGATNRLLGIDRATGRPRYGPTKGGAWWIAEHAAAWLRGAPNRFLWDDVRLGDEADSYHWPLPTGEEGGQVRRRAGPAPA